MMKKGDMNRLGSKGKRKEIPNQKVKRRRTKKMVIAVTGMGD